MTNESSLVEDIPIREMDNYVKYAKGRMKKKILGAAEAIRQGVKEVIIADGRIDKPISGALIGKGTIIH